MLSMIPGLGNQLKGADLDDSTDGTDRTIIYSMTKEERGYAKIINPSRRKRLLTVQGC